MQEFVESYMSCITAMETPLYNFDMYSLLWLTLTMCFVASVQAKQEAAEAEEAKRELGIDGENSLQALIKAKSQSRAAEMDSFFAHLEKKYAEPEKKKTKKRKK